ncbi:MAG TPA: leucine-rich repeat domain-containing protein [Cellvibrionaceae bacterium]
MKLLIIIGIFGIATTLIGCNAQPAPGSTTLPPIFQVRQKLSELTFDSPWIKSCIADAQLGSKIQYVDELTALRCVGYPKGFESYIRGQQGRDMIVTSTRGIEQLTALKELDLSDNYIAYIDLSSLKNLTTLDLSGNLLQNLDLSHYAQLKKLAIAGNPLYHLTLPQNGQLESLILADYKNSSYLGISTLKSHLNSGGELLTDKRFFDEQSSLLLADDSFKRLKNLDFSQQRGLKNLFAQNAQLKNIALGTFPVNNSVEQLDLSMNELTSVDLNRLAKLQTLNVSANNIASLDLTALTQLQTLNVSFNKPTLTKITALKGNKLKSIDLTGTHVSDEDLQNLFASKSLEVVNMAGAGTNFTPASIAPSLTVLNVSGHYTSTDFAAATNLKELSLSGGSIKGLDFSGLTHLEKITISGTQIELGATISCADRLASLGVYTLDDTFSLKTAAQCSIGSLGLSSDKILNKVDLSALNVDEIAIIARDTSYKNIALNTSLKSISLDGVVDADRFSFYDFQYLQNLRFANTRFSTLSLKGAGADLTSFSLENVFLDQLDLSGNYSPISKLDFYFVDLAKLNLTPVARTLKELRLVETSITQLETPKLNSDIKLSIYALKLDEKSQANFKKATGYTLDANGNGPLNF